MIVSEKKSTVRNSSDVARVVRALMERFDDHDKQTEHFWLMILNGRHVIQEVHLISMGCLTSAIVHPREVFRPAVFSSAAAVIVAHNHLSGDPTPSEEDRKLTERLAEAGKILGINMLDHIVVGDGNQFTSLLDGKG